MLVCVCCVSYISIFSDLSSSISQRTANSVRHTRHASRADGADARAGRRAERMAERRVAQAHTCLPVPRARPPRVSRSPVARAAACGETVEDGQRSMYSTTPY